MSIRDIIPFPIEPHAYRLNCIVAIARAHWRWARDERRPEVVRNVHQLIHDVIATHIEAYLARDDRNWSALSNELAELMKAGTHGLAPIGTSGTVLAVYQGAEIALAVLGGSALDRPREFS